MKRQLAAAFTFDALAEEIFLRLLGEVPRACADPLDYLDRTAGEVQTEWRARTQRRPHNCTRGEQQPVPCTPDRQRVQAVFDALPHQQRELLMLHVKEGMPYQRIAQLKGMTQEQALQALARAYSQLRFKLEALDEAEHGLNRH